jgi:DNA-directed RNA polymerase sigma subunit (sigma70/sigma32)
VIWRNLVQKANEQMDSDQLADLMDYIMEASTEMKLNGLEIRNLVTMATQLAHSQHEGLAQRHLRIVIRKSRDFSQYLLSLHSLDNEELAYKHGAR